MIKDKLSSSYEESAFSKPAPLLTAVDCGNRECYFYSDIVRHFTQDGVNRRNFSHFDDQHFDISRRSIEKAACIPCQKNHAVILGAGNLTDIPIENLVETYNKVTLVDIDTPSVKAAVATRLPSEYQHKLAYIQADLTGIIGKIYPLIHRVVDDLPSPNANIDKEKLLALFESSLDAVYRQGLSLQGEFPDVRGDFVSISLVLSQLGVFIRDYAQSCFNEKYDSPEIPESTRETAAYDALSQKIQADFLDTVVKTVEPAGIIYVSISIRFNIDVCDDCGQWQQRDQVELVKDEMMMDWLSQFDVKDRSSWQWRDLDGEGLRRTFDIDAYTVSFPV